MERGYLLVCTSIGLVLMGLAALWTTRAECLSCSALPCDSHEDCNYGCACLPPAGVGAGRCVSTYPGD